MQAFRNPKILSKNRPEKGLGISLIEVLIAMSILSVGLMALAQMQIVALKHNTRSQHKNTARLVGQKALGAVVNQQYANLDDIAGLTTETVDEIDYKIEVTVGPQDQPVTDTRVVIIKVSWDDGKKREFEWLTLRARVENEQGS